MQTINLQIKDELLPVFMKIIAGFGNDIVFVNKKPVNELSKSGSNDELIDDDFSQYTKLSRLKSRPNTAIGNSDDLVNISWEKELNLDFPN